MTDIIESILELPKQCRQAWEEASKITFPDWNIENIVVCGMGGSALAAHVVQSVAPLKKPLLIVNDYSLPEWSNENTLVILSSYSGNTEEVLSCAKLAEERNCKIVGITSGGKLAEWLNEKTHVAYIFEPTFNKTAQPRMGIGYGLLAILAILNSLNLIVIQLTGEAMDSYFERLDRWGEGGGVEAEAKEIAEALYGKLPIIFASDYLNGNAHIFANQLNETSKTFSTWFSLPEANHHLIEGLKHPEMKNIAVFLGNHYPENILNRFHLTKDILAKNGWEIYWINSSVQHELYLCLHTLFLSSMTTAYLGLKYGEDPLAIPTVNYFKQKLG